MTHISEQLSQGRCPAVSTDWLYENLDRPQLIVVDCRFSLANPALELIYKENLKGGGEVQENS